jgi:hypothetical protein
MLGLEITGPGAVPRLTAGLGRPRPAAGQTLVRAGELTLRMDAYPLSAAAEAWQALADGTATGG